MPEGEPRKPSQARGIATIAVLLAVALAATWAWRWRTGGWRPQVDVKNDGAVAVRVETGEGPLVVAPGATGSFRWTIGDSFLVACDDAPGPPWKVYLGPEPVRGRAYATTEKRAGRKVSFTVDVRDPP